MHKNIFDRIYVVLAVALVLSISACSPTMRFKPGEIPAAKAPEPALKKQTESYVNAHVSQNNYKQIKSGAQLDRVKRIVNRLAVAAGYPANTFPVHLVDAGEEVNAAAFNGTTIVVYRELLNRVKSDDELATVLGHEIGHIMASHHKDAAESQEREQTVGILSSVLGSVASVATSAAGYGGVAGTAGSITRGATGVVGMGAYVRSFDRTQEYEADHIGIIIMTKAGYDPYVAPQFWDRSEEVFGSSSSTVGAFFSTHPASRDRSEEIKKTIPIALQMAGKKTKT